MRKAYLTTVCCFSIFLFCCCLAGCGGQEDSGDKVRDSRQTGMNDLSAAADGQEYYDIKVEQEPVFQWEQEKEGTPLAMQEARFIGMQFYQGEPVQLWKVPDIGRGWRLDLCLYRMDGSREVIVQGIDGSGTEQGYLDQEGNLYWWHDAKITEEGWSKTDPAGLKKYGASGEVLFETELDTGQNILDMCQTADGRIYLTIRSTDTTERWLAELDTADGSITKLCGGQPVAAGDLELGIYGEHPVLWIGRRFTEINADSGAGAEPASCVLSLEGTSYVNQRNAGAGRILQDFRILEDGSVEILWAASSGRNGLWEKLQTVKIDRTLITVRGWGSGTWFANQVSSFNQQSETYHVIVEDQAEDREDFARLTSVQVASGKGPDILMGSLMEDYILGMMEKGVLEDLRPYMEEKGIREEDYFPYVFAAWRNGEGIYSVTPAVFGLNGCLLDSSLLGGTEEPDIQSLVEALLSMQGDAVFLEGYDSQELLALLLGGTDTLWGMVDWERGSCDFSGKLFDGILEAAGRYGDHDGRRDKACIAQPRNLADIFHFDSRADRERDGKTVCGVLFDDGCHAVARSDLTLAVNVNSANKDGAWEFIAFLLGEQAQSDGISIPAGRRSFELWVEAQRERVAGGKEIHEMVRGTTQQPDGSWTITEHRVYSEADITEERIEEYRALLEDARTYPIRTAPILAIISEEAEDYFQGSKSPEEVCRLITNRVQLYLDEGR